MSAKPLTKKELAWIKKLERVFQECPSERLECFTIGDPTLTFYDKNVYREHELSLGFRAPGCRGDGPAIAQDSGAYFMDIDTKVSISGVCG